MNYLIKNNIKNYLVRLKKDFSENICWLFFLLIVLCEYIYNKVKGDQNVEKRRL